MELRISGVAAGGDGLARRADGKVVFCEGALPGELVEAEVVDDRRDFARAVLTAVLEPSPGRVPPPCAYVAAGCGGCSWQHVGEATAVTAKQAIVVDALRRIAHLPDVAVAPPPAGRPVVPLAGHRTSVRLAVDPDGRPAYRRRHGTTPVVVDECMVAHPALGELIVASRFPGAREVVLRVSAADGGRLAAPDRGAGRASVPAGTRVATRRRPASVREQVDGRWWQVSAHSFFQSGPHAAEALVAAVLAAAGSAGGAGARIVDLYAGVGVLGGAVASRWPGSSLLAVESSADAAADAVANLADLDARVLVAEVATVEAAPAELVIADPARSGLGPSAARAVVAFAAPVAVLVSCDPASMARDVGLFAAGGYRLESVEVLDLFPGTFHVETVSRLVR